MTSEVDGLETNEFLRRRKLRLQQVREQSKDIAKKIRQRAKVEKLRQVVELDTRKQKEYLQRQGRLVKQLEEYYSKGIENVGASHRSASELRGQGDQVDKIDLSKQRGKEAAAELKKKRQKILDEQKKLLDRKLQAREVANEISREKSAAVINKVQSKTTGSVIEEAQSKTAPDLDKDDKTKQSDQNHKDIGRNDMATQWDLEEMPIEWEPNIPLLALPKDDISVKESNNNVDSKSDKSKRLDLFALSEEMPNSLRGITTQEGAVAMKSSLTLVSEYLQNRGLRLREKDTTSPSKKTEDLQSIKQTILRTRASKEVPAKATNKESKASAQSSGTQKKGAVTIYNHSTRDTRDIPCDDEQLVVRDLQSNDDAYSKAMKENTTKHMDKEHQKKVQEIRSKVAMTKQSVEKEYRDTISFLNALPKDKGNKVIKTAYMDDDRQQMQRQSRQQKLQHEYRKIEKECSKHICKKKSHGKTRSKENDDVFESTDFRYSWMPVPEGDGNLAVHTIPTTLKEGKSGSSVQFSKVDSYHEYRSRHKHTPPTKDTAQEKPKRNVEAVLVQNTSDSESSSSDTSTETINLYKEDKSKKVTDKLSDAERIVIYKIMDSNKKSETSKLMKDIAKSLSLIQKQNKHKPNTENDDDEQSRRSTSKKPNTNSEDRLSFEQLSEGIYKADNENGDNIASMYFQEEEKEKRELPRDDSMTKNRSCSCRKKIDEQGQDKTGVNTTQWDGGDKPTTSRSPVVCQEVCVCHCNCKNSTKTKPVQASLPSAATSTFSFKTATYDKANNPLPDGGVIKVVDDGGQETGKFYIGATGFLKDDEYEVVIQLRKKGDEKESKVNVTQKSDCHSQSNKEPVNIDNVSVTVAETITPSEPDNELDENKDKVADTVSTSLPTPKGVDAKRDAAKVVSETLTDTFSKPTIYSTDSSVNVKNKATDHQISEKGPSTADRDDNTVSVDVSKNNLVPRPATSTYTQTSMSSPTHRPVFFHMSSSTSTAYMSPPELILPTFLRQDYQLTDEEVCAANKYTMDNTELTDQLEHSEEYDYRCRKTTRSKKPRSRSRDPAHRCRRAEFPYVETRPSTKSEEDLYFRQENKKNVVPPLSCKKSKYKCRKCEFHKNTPRHKETRQRDLASTKKSQNMVMRITPSTGSSNKNIQTKYNAKTTLKPVIKRYVDKLLILNRESLKAVKVIDQECSSVTTPGSSIIDVSNNVDPKKTPAEPTISLHQITTMMKEKIKNLSDKIEEANDDISLEHTEVYLKKTFNKRIKPLKMPRKKTAQKLKSLNISRNLFKPKTNAMQQLQNKDSSSPYTKKECVTKEILTNSHRPKGRSKSSPTPRLAPCSDTTCKSGNSDITQATRKRNNQAKFYSKFPGYDEAKLSSKCPKTSHRATLTSTSTDSDKNTSTLKRNNVQIPLSISTQTSLNIDSDSNYMKLAEDKLQNMEKIADLTEKCTQRLSNLAKVLEEVRKNKSLVYSQISSSDTASDNDQKSDKIPAPPHEPLNNSKTFDSNTPVGSITSEKSKEIDNSPDCSDYVPFLSDIPKPVVFKNITSDLVFNTSSSSSKRSNSPVSENNEHMNKSRGKPPPALSRIHLKHGQDYIVPHELSTVVEVDSPMSVKMKSSRNDTKLDIPDPSNRNNNVIKESRKVGAISPKCKKKIVTPDTSDINIDSVSNEMKLSTADSSNNSKIQMIDMEQFNEIMLKPFFSIQEYAKQCNVGVLDDGSNMDDIVKDDLINDEFSSLHSDGSLPDVISELLKRNIISEPFKFDTGSNANSTTVSSESTMSVLALSKMRQVKKKSNLFQNKENITETSDTLSISSNPDLENAFKKLGMGWASSTLKKTKERLALSSSSNTSSSSLSQFKIKSFNQDIPALVTDTVSSVLNLSNKPVQHKMADTSKSTQQQTSLTNSMTVKEFLAKELANKITFNNKSRNDTEEEFVSLFETKMPEEMKQSSCLNREEYSIDNSHHSGNNNRARTSTPVQLFKSSTYHTSSSSNISNGLFSNADDLSSVKITSNSMKHSTSDKDDLVIPSFSLRMKKGSSECSKSDE